MPVRDLDPDDLERRAGALEEEARLLRELAHLRRGQLTGAERSARIQPVTGLGRKRGLAIATARAGADPLARALTERGWTLRRYAKHLGVSAAQLSNYRRGIHPIPRRIADRAHRELGVSGPAIWPAGVAE